MTEDEMIGWYHQLNGDEFEQTLGDSEGQGSPECYSPWGCKELDTTQRLNDNKFSSFLLFLYVKYLKINYKQHDNLLLNILACSV